MSGVNESKKDLQQKQDEKHNRRNNMELRRIKGMRPADSAAVAALRHHLGLSPIKQGKRDCLSCSKPFMSYDLVNQKCCVNCRRDEDHAARNASAGLAP
jgi:hypothetical protein